MKGIIKDWDEREYEYYKLNSIRIKDGFLIINYTDVYDKNHEESNVMPKYLHVFQENRFS